MCVVLACEKGRCTVPSLLWSLERMASVALAVGCTFRFTWVSLERCPSDADSRRFERFPSASATEVPSTTLSEFGGREYCHHDLARTSRLARSWGTDARCIRRRRPMPGPSAENPIWNQYTTRVARGEDATEQLLQAFTASCSSKHRTQDPIQCLTDPNNDGNAKESARVLRVPLLPSGSDGGQAIQARGDNIATTKKLRFWFLRASSRFAESITRLRAPCNEKVARPTFKNRDPRSRRKLEMPRSVNTASRRLLWRWTLACAQRKHEASRKRDWGKGAGSAPTVCTVTRSQRRCQGW